MYEPRSAVPVVPPQFRSGYIAQDHFVVGPEGSVTPVPQIVVPFLRSAIRLARSLFFSKASISAINRNFSLIRECSTHHALPGQSQPADLQTSNNIAACIDEYYNTINFEIRLVQNSGEYGRTELHRYWSIDIDFDIVYAGAKAAAERTGISSGSRPTPVLRGDCDLPRVGTEYKWCSGLAPLWTPIEIRGGDNFISLPIRDMLVCFGEGGFRWELEVIGGVLCRDLELVHNQYDDQIRRLLLRGVDSDNTFSVVNPKTIRSIVEGVREEVNTLLPLPFTPIQLSLLEPSLKLRGTTDRQCDNVGEIKENAAMKTPKRCTVRKY